MLTIVTHVNVNREIDRSRCFQSVERAIGSFDVDWNIVRLGCKSHEDFLFERHASILSRNGFVAFVDDDDWIEPNTIKLLLKAIERNPSAGIIYSDENHVLSKNDIIHVKAGQCYEDLYLNAGRMHHICAINAKYITKKSLYLALIAKCGVEWTMKAEAALQYGAIYIPKPLYNYFIHSNRVTTKVNINFKNCKEIFYQQFYDWQKHFGKIPQFNTNEA